ncbi:putative SP-containing protein [Vairimorpha necatrix]|uniref:SP-containing protein n=1 Tax=Vairimorpha necatrix TaxID=6039 RepID=A0AAX4JAT1_9MICR
MFILVHFIFYACTITHINANISIQNPTLNVKNNFDDLPLNLFQYKNIKHYNKVVGDYFSAISEHPEIKRRIDDLISKNGNISKSVSLVVLLIHFKQELQDFILGKKYDPICSFTYTFFESLAYHSYKTILRLSDLKNINKYKKHRDNIIKQIIKSIDIKYAMDCDNIIEVLFNTVEYQKIFAILNEINANNQISRGIRYALPRHTTTKKPFVFDYVKVEYIGPSTLPPQRHHRFRKLGV